LRGLRRIQRFQIYKDVLSGNSDLVKQYFCQNQAAGIVSH
jgi:hypothetical protein